MNPYQHYREKAARAERLADDPFQRADMRAELRSIARRWRHMAEQADWLVRSSRFIKA
ncbi:hypothetical protein [Microvirga mediterraneensis]|uniref:Uncharacterized protein n=1 Tax=Microvirga mediterraneensis TaxID=2754695 RepID=A0A838BRS8_9HYPH|nr:hypothetical protein [Microvirga mediterraneensis]MBA1157623.1 hypothetical protein [Microvirga mediterraneensis]